MQESTLSPWAIRDDTTGRGYYPASPYGKDGAIVIASLLAAKGHTIDLGYAGIDSIHFIHKGMSFQEIENAVSDVFDPSNNGCGNFTRGERVLQGKYVVALGHYAPGIAALTMALYWYNGAGPHSAKYAQEVIARARSFAISIPMPDEPWPAQAAQVPVVLTAGAPADTQNIEYAGYRSLPSSARSVQPRTLPEHPTAARSAVDASYQTALRALRARQQRERLAAAAQIRARLNHLGSHTSQ